ncbi:PRD domain-containing protein [Saccharibacillus sp. CPCC 101409]|uniref:BglG family transcription antiterminator n=1 Tax=Saccharibacillus sp. CPCC 101409 TaxID=3058041 RepID=UPI0026739833|nr:PRD domain-containing protein [Saccharibacillus sp. CPCC 101409]MDO3410873.1 PRD domain-containing protein [Saccharibacillus sp. CPCC 101409]
MPRENENFEVERVIGSNVVMARGERSGEEFVIIGKGIGFTIKNGGIVEAEDPRIEKRFRLEDREEWGRYRMLLENIDPEVIRISNEIVGSIEERFGIKPDDKIYLALPSHIQFTVYRLRNGMDIVNPLLEATRLSFPKEFELAARAAERIGREFGLEVPEDEIGFLTYHVYSALSSVPVGQVVRTSNIVGDLLETIRRENLLDLPPGGMNMVRLTIHLRCLLERLLREEKTSNPLLPWIEKECGDAFRLAQRLASRIRRSLDVDVPREETGFLALHLHRMMYASK